MRKPWWAALAATIVLLAGCHNGGHAQNSTRMRALNAVSDSEALDVLVDDDVKVSSLALGQTSSTSEFDAGTRDTKIRSSSNGAVLLEKSVAYNDGAMNTLAIIGKRGAMNTMLLPDDTTNPSSGKFKVRGVGLSPDAGAVDLYITSGSVTDTVATIAGIGYTTVTDYTEGTPGSYRVVFTAANTKDVLFQSAPLTLSEGQALSAAVFPSGGGKLVNAVLLVNGQDGAGTFLPNPLGRFKAVNAIPDAGLLNFKADGTTALANVPFAGGSTYVTLPSGDRSFSIERANVPGVAIASKTQTINPASDFTVIALGTAASPQLAVIPDDNGFPATGFAKLRFVNAMNGEPTVDAFVNFASQATGVAYGAASSYSLLVPSTTYNISFATPGGVTTLASIDPAELDAGGVYTAYIAGSPGSVQAKLVRDR